MKVRLNEVDFSGFERNDFGERWEDEYPDIPGAIEDYFNESGCGFPEPGNIQERGHGYFATVDEREFYFYREDDVREYVLDNYFDMGWEDAFYSKEINIDIIQSRYAGMYLTDHARETIEDCLREIEVENGNEEAEDDTMYIYDKYMDTGNGLTCTDEAIDILTSEEHYEDFMNRLFSDKDTFDYFMEKYGYHSDYSYEGQGYIYIGDGWYVEEC